jgi:glycerophosphoryl diester phosphodiesterase
MRFLLALAVTLSACSPALRPPEPDAHYPLPTGFDAQGHRGARGELPENTIPSMLRALDAGMTTLELDLAVTADGDLLLSHEPWMNPAICSHPDGTPVAEAEAQSLNIFRMTTAQAQAFDCGARGHAGFPDQQPQANPKPTLAATIAAADAHARALGRPLPYYNVETKSMPEGDHLMHPAPAAFAALVVEELRRAGALERATIQSFDPRTLREARRIDTRVPLALLVEPDAAHAHSPAAGVEVLGFTPAIYSPHHGLVTADRLAEAHALGMRVVPWTVNEASRMEALVALGVDGLITDYPTRLAGVLGQMGVSPGR